MINFTPDSPAETKPQINFTPDPVPTGEKKINFTPDALPPQSHAPAPSIDWSAEVDAGLQKLKNLFISPNPSSMLDRVIGAGERVKATKDEVTRLYENSVDPKYDMPSRMLSSLRGALGLAFGVPSAGFGAADELVTKNSGGLGSEVGALAQAPFEIVPKLMDAIATQGNHKIPKDDTFKGQLYGLTRELGSMAPLMVLGGLPKGEGVKAEASKITPVEEGEAPAKQIGPSPSLNALIERFSNLTKRKPSAFEIKQMQDGVDPLELAGQQTVDRGIEDRGTDIASNPPEKKLPWETVDKPTSLDDRGIDLNANPPQTADGRPQLYSGGLDPEDLLRKIPDYLHDLKTSLFKSADYNDALHNRFMGVVDYAEKIMKQLQDGSMNSQGGANRLAAVIKDSGLDQRDRGEVTKELLSGFPPKQDVPQPISDSPPPSAPRSEPDPPPVVEGKGRGESPEPTGRVTSGDQSFFPLKPKVINDQGGSMYSGAPIPDDLSAEIKRFGLGMLRSVSPERLSTRRDVSTMANKMESWSTIEGERAERRVRDRVGKDEATRKAVGLIAYTEHHTTLELQEGLERMMKVKRPDGSPSITIPLFEKALKIASERGSDASAIKGGLEAQRGKEIKGGVEVPQLDNYFPIRAAEWMSSGDQFDFFDPAARGASRSGFLKERKYETPWDSLAAIEEHGGTPELDASKLVGMRVRDGVWQMAKEEFVREGQKMIDPHTEKPIIRTDEEGVSKAGYSEVKIGDKPVQVLDSYKGLFESLFSSRRLGEPFTTLSSASQVYKRYGVGWDIFHAFYQAQAYLGARGLSADPRALALMTPTEGKMLMEMSEKEIRKTGEQEGISPDQIETSVNRAQIFQRGIRFLKIKSAEQTIDPLAKAVGFGRAGRYIFSSLARSMMAETYVDFYQRNTKRFPGKGPDQLAAVSAREVNAIYTNMGKEGLIKNADLKSLASIMFFAENFAESQATSEVMAYSQLAKAPTDFIKTGTVGNVVKQKILWLTGLIALNHLINYSTRGHSTFSNPEPDKKFSAWIPGIKRDGVKLKKDESSEGFFHDPWVLPMPVSSAVAYSMRRGSDPAEAILGWMRMKLGVVPQTIATLKTGETTLGEPVEGKEKVKALAEQTATVPFLIKELVGGGDDVTKQLAASAGLKISPKPVVSDEATKDLKEKSYVYRRAAWIASRALRKKEDFREEFIDKEVAKLPEDQKDEMRMRIVKAMRGKAKSRGKAEGRVEDKE